MEKNGWIFLGRLILLVESFTIPEKVESSRGIPDKFLFETLARSLKLQSDWLRELLQVFPGN